MVFTDTNVHLCQEQKNDENDVDDRVDSFDSSDSSDKVEEIEQFGRLRKMMQVQVGKQVHSSIPTIIARVPKNPVISTI